MNAPFPKAVADTRPALPPGGILGVVLVYAAFASLWILLSDEALGWLFKDPASITLASTLKGGLFVAITTLLLYGLMRRLTGPDPLLAGAFAGRRRPGLPMVLLGIFILALTVGAIARTLVHQREKEVAQLQAIAELKARQIEDWLKERVGDAEFAGSSEFFADKYRRWQEEGDLASRDVLQVRMEELSRNPGFTGVMLLDKAGVRLWGSGQVPLSVAAPLLAGAREAARDGRQHMVGPYRDGAGALRLDFVVPLKAPAGHPPVVVLTTDPADWLFHTLRNWPAPGASGEMLLFRRDGDQVLFLNDLRHGSGGALNWRLPLASPSLLEARALREGVPSGSLLEGEDYRGTPVLGVVQRIAGSDWFLLAKLDRAEVYEDAVRDGLWIGLTGLLLLFASGAGFHLLRQHQQLQLAAGLRQSQDERLRAQGLLTAIADSSEDAIFAKDMDGRYLLFNRAACRFVGKSMEEVLGRDDRALFPAEQAEFLMAQGRRVVADNRIHTMEEFLSTGDGERVFLGTKGPLRDGDGRVVGIFGISRDITERRQTEARLRESEERLHLALDATRDGLWDWDLRSGLAYLSPRYFEMTGYRAEDVTPDFEFFKRTVHPDDLPRVLDSMSAHMEGRAAGSEFDYRLVTPAGEVRWMQGRGQVVERDGDGKPLRMVGTITDIGARKAGEDALRRQAEELASRNAELERFNRVSVGRELDMIGLKQIVNELSLQAGREAPFPLAFLDESPRPAEAGEP